MDPSSGRPGDGTLHPGHGARGRFRRPAVGTATTVCDVAAARPPSSSCVSSLEDDRRPLFMHTPDLHGIPAVSIRNAHRSFGDPPVLTGVDFAVAPGRCGAVVGANGAGKSTLLRCVVGADRLDEGAIDIAARPWTRPPGPSGATSPR
ncbi:ATP-binding cassette domain-containing protein [Rhodococcus zopfii]|uniref:ATP-binding cassette domain-containing protein n=1 Tax=Rhodococcus zopfii TaxID=43772 RepID=UPI0030B88651